VKHLTVVKQTLRSGRWSFRTYLILMALWWPLAILAQVPQERTVPLEEQVKQEMADSRFHLGPIRLLPRFSVSEAGYNSNLFGTPAPTVSDWTAAVSAGLHMLLPLGSKMYLRGDALPEYYWYAHHPEQRSLGGQYAASWLGFFNRMSTDLSGGYSKKVSPLSSEIEGFVTHELVDGSANLEVNLSRRWSLFAGGEGHRLRYSSEGTRVTNVEELDRDDLAAHTGIRYRWTSFFNVAAEVKETQGQFVQSSQPRDNRTTAYLLGVYYNRDRFFVNLNAGYQVGRPYNGSAFAPLSTSTGSYFVSYFLTQPIELQAYGHRGTQYSQFEQNAYFIETRNALGITVKIGYRVGLHGYGEYGTNQYPVPVLTGTELVNREDRFTTVGGGLSVLFFRSASITALINQRRVSSNIPGLDRSVLRFTTNLTFQGNFNR
jgi:hypothetical protein